MRRSRRTLSPKPGVSHSCSVSPAGVRSISCASANSVTCGASRTSPTSRPSSVRASVVLPTLVCDTRLRCRWCGAFDHATKAAGRGPASMRPAARPRPRPCRRRAGRRTAARMPSEVPSADQAPRRSARRGEAAPKRCANAPSSTSISAGSASVRIRRPWLSASGVAPRSNSATRSVPAAGRRARLVLGAVGHGGRHLPLQALAEDPREQRLQRRQCGGIGRVRMRPHLHRRAATALLAQQALEIGLLQRQRQAPLQPARAPGGPQRQRQPRQHHQQHQLPGIEVDPRRGRRAGRVRPAGTRSACTPATSGTAMPDDGAGRCQQRGQQRAAPCRRRGRCFPSRRGSRAPGRAGTCPPSRPAPAPPRPGAAPVRCAPCSAAGRAAAQSAAKASTPPRCRQRL